MDQKFLTQRFVNGFARGLQVNAESFLLETVNGLYRNGTILAVIFCFVYVNFVTHATIVWSHLETRTCHSPC